MENPKEDHLSHDHALSAKAQPPPETKHQHIWVITGPAGCGKTTVAQFLSKNLSLTYLEGDDYHSPESVAKMSANIALTDADRWDWLETLRDAAVSALTGNSKLPGCVVTCSALKLKYRDVMRIAAYKNPHIRVHFVYLSASETVLVSRVSSRQNHYMKPDMVQSQLKDLEAPTPDEQDVISVDVSATVQEVEEEALRKVREAVSGELARDS